NAGGSNTSKAAAIQISTSTDSLPSDGSGTVDIKVTVRDANNVLLPNAAVTFTATSGGLSAGQVISDASGIAAVTLTTAGDTSVRTITVTARIGTTLTSTANVTVYTSVSRVTLTSEAPAIAGDGSAGTTLSARVLNMNNQAAVGATVTFTATAGGIVLITQGVTDDTGVAKATITSDKNNVKVSVDATASSGGVPSNTITLKVVNSIDFTRSQTSLPSDGTRTSTLTATVKDVAGNAIAGLPVTFTAPTAVLSVSQATTNASGVATTVLSVGTDTSDRIVSATATAGGLVATTTVTIAAPVSFVSVSSNVASIPTDGSSTATITATVRNANNQFVAGVPVAFTASSGGIAVTQAVTDSNGVATAVLSTANNSTPRTISVTAIAGGITSSPVTVQVAGSGPNSVASVIVASSMSALPTDGSATATITATVRNSSNVGVSGVPVSFSATSGSLAVVTAVSDSSGNVTATLSIGTDHTARNITVSATAGGVTGSTVVSVGGLYVVTATTSAPSIPSDGSVPAEIRAYVRNASNQLVQGVTVTFTASSGGLTVTQAVTDSTGTAVARLTPAGDPTNRTITVTANANSVSAQVSVDVIGTTISIQGPDSLGTTQAGTYSAQLVDSSAHPIVGKTVTVTTSRGTLSGSSFTTDATGRISFNLTAPATAGTSTLTVTGAGATGTKDVTVSAETFILTITGSTDINLGASRTVTLTWMNGASPVAGSAVTFSTTRGTITAHAATTNGSGVVTATLTSATEAGGAVVTAVAGTPPNTKNAQLVVQFLATTPAAISLQPDSSTIGPTQSTNVTATVRDVNGNVIKDQVVLFTLSDLSGGTLSTGVATTDSSGRAKTVYTASTTTNPNVRITGTLQSNGTITSTTQIAVGQQALFLALGTGNSIDEPNTTQYHIRYQAQVTDANGHGVANVPLTVKVWSVSYVKGTRVISGAKWGTQTSTLPGETNCTDEDTNRNGVLDMNPGPGTGEDYNSNGRLDAGNIVTVTPTSISTDANGFANLDLYYPQEYAYYLTVDLIVSANVQGTEYTRTARFLIPGISTDFSDISVAPPGLVSPFGEGATCSAPD
ncbi:MAG: hypothetical protein RLZZ200_1756, partial [Pseudomonadota bacterium]